MSRPNPLGNLDDFQVGAAPKPMEHAQIDKLARTANFPNRKAVMPADPDATPAIAKPAVATPQAVTSAPAVASSDLGDLRARARTRRYTTGRNQQGEHPGDC